VRGKVEKGGGHGGYFTPGGGRDRLFAGGIAMTAAPKLPPKLTPEEYLAIERKAEFRSEFLNGKMFAMAGASPFHNSVKENLIIEIGSRLKGGPCRSYSSDQRVKVSATGLYTYPDIVIVCGQPEFETGQPDVLINPRIIIEVLSDSTANYDRGLKFRHYQQIESFQEYILVAQDEPAIERLIRQSQWDWLSRTFAGLDAELELATVPAKVRLSDIYAGVEFPPLPDPSVEQRR
jgi:Uma2 family endonuclease